MLKCKRCSKDIRLSYGDATNNHLIEKQLCLICDHFDGLIGNSTVINGQVYSIGEEDAFWKGMYGRYYKIRYFDGETIETTNLWHRGEVPEYFKNDLPDNAEFV